MLANVVSPIVTQEHRASEIVRFIDLLTTSLMFMSIYVLGTSPIDAWWLYHAISIYLSIYICPKWIIHPASRGVAAHTAGLFRSVRGAKGGFPPWGLFKLRSFNKKSFQNIVFDSVFPMFPVKRTVIYTFFAIKAVNPSKTLLLTVFL